jgi:hypothetical protein
VNIQHYLDEVRLVYATGVATEHSYRPALLKLFHGIDPSLTVVNEPKKVAVGAPDFIFSRGDVPIGWCEAKDLDADIKKLKGYSKEQKDRYRRGLPNLLYTNGLDFEFLRGGERTSYVTVADYRPGLPAYPERFDQLSRLLDDFAAANPISITAAAQLAKLMAAKAAIIKDVLGNVLREDPDFRSALGSQYQAFKADLLPHLDPGEFADIYAETITYGMFAARLHDTSLDTFSRREALDLLPKSNPFLRSLFGYIAGPELDDRIAWIVDDLADVLRASNPSLLFKDFGKFTARNDPFIHFYEDFLKEYNPSKRKSRGVWYTPEPVVDFIVRAVDDVLRTEFGLADGLADTSKVVVNYDTGTNNPKTGKPVTMKKELHRVQILDPATGTGTFLAKAVQTIAAQVKARAPGKWSGYVEQDLIPRLHGFELLMASYAMCHMKLDMQLRDTGYTPSANPPRLSVWLTNALEEGEREVRDLFFTALADEARGANEVKRNRPIMCVIGNPPYSGESANKGAWITRLMEAYKKEPGGKKRLNERNPKWINDDYVKFMRMAEHLIEQNGEGVLGFITNHSYLDNPTFRGMRWHLLRSFDKVYVLDLHGSSKRREVAPEGVSDVNVFDIQQGVSVIIAVKKRTRARDLATVWHGELWGSRKAKAEALWAGSIPATTPTELPLRGPQFALIERDHSLEQVYQAGFSLSQFMPVNSNGVVTARDSLTVDNSRDMLRARMEVFRAGKPEQMRQQFGLGADVRDWRVEFAQADLKKVTDNQLQIIAYRPFDPAWTYYTGKSRGFHCYPRADVMRNYIIGPNLGLLVSKAHKDAAFAHVFVTQTISEAIFLSGTTASNAMNLPLYLYAVDEEDARGQKGMESRMGSKRRLNFDAKIYATICTAASLSPSPVANEGDAFRTLTGDARPTEVKVLDYIYGVLHAPVYRNTYAEFFRIDFPHVPYPRDPDTFVRLSAIGEQLRRLHLLEPAAVGDAPFPFTGDGDDMVMNGYPKLDGDRVLINAAQGFDSVPVIAWEFLVGGYRPAQKWLKDRRGRALSWEDVSHYQRIMKVLVETDRIMGEISIPS